MKQTPQLLTLALAVTLAISASGAHVLAQETASPTPDSNITESLKNKLKETINAVETTEVNTSLIGYIGKVKDIVKNTIVIEDKSGKKNILTDDNSEIVRSPGNTDIKLESVRIGDSIIAMGTNMDSNQEIQGKRIIVSDSTFTPPEKLTDIGTVTKISKYSFSLSTKSSSDMEVFFTTKTVFKSPSQALELDDINVGDVLLFTAGKDKDGDWSTSVAMRIKESSN